MGYVPYHKPERWEWIGIAISGGISFLAIVAAGVYCISLCLQSGG